METRVLGNNLKVSAIGLGCMGFSHAYGAPIEEKEAVQSLKKAFDLGYTFFDTAEIYGTEADPHANEKLVGKAIRGIRDKVQISTKFGIHWDENSNALNRPVITDASPKMIRASVEASLKRLQTDYIDIYFQHRMDPHVEPEAVAETMGELIREGKILHWGISETNEDYLRRAHTVCPVAAVQNRYSMMARHYEPLFATLEELHVGLVAFSPMANGFLSGVYNGNKQFDPHYDYRSGMPQFKEEAVEQNRKLLEMIRDLAIQKAATQAQIALAWMLCKKPWIVPIPGSRNIERMMENAGAASVELSSDEVAAIDAALDEMSMSAVYGGAPITQ